MVYYFVLLLLEGVNQPGVGTLGQVDLAHVSGNDEFGTGAHAGEEHFQLVACGVLCLVKDDKGVVERASPHVGEGGDLYDVRFQVFFQFFGRNHVCQRVIERLQVGVHLFFHVSGQESEAFSCLNGRTAQHDALDFAVAQGFDR